MKEDDVVRFYEKEILGLHSQVEHLMEEIKRKEKILQTIKGDASSEKALESGGSEIRFPQYPLDGSLVDKFRYLEDVYGRVWRRKDMVELIKKAEGDNA